MATAAAQTLQVTLVPSNYNGANISCFGMKDGAIDLSVIGGVAPYTYEWSTGASTEDIADLPSGYYKVSVKDVNGAYGDAQITLMDPDPIKMRAEAVEYGNGFNISCYSCFNGSINVTTLGGTIPYSYLWKDGTTTEDRSGLGARDYYVTMTDANGCTTDAVGLTLREPERSDWTMTGNAGTNPGTHFFGTTDAQDVVFKSNGAERLRVKANGNISLLGPQMGEGPLYRMANGELRGGGNLIYPTLETGCRGLSVFAFWKVTGNAFEQLCPDDRPVLGTLSNRPLEIVTNNVLRMFIASNGKVGIGTYPSASPAYRLFVENGIACRDVLVQVGPWPDHVFEPNYGLMPLAELRSYLTEHCHLPGIPSAAAVAEAGGLEVGRMQTDLLKVVEEQALYILQLEARLHRMEQRMDLVETTK